MNTLDWNALDTGQRAHIVAVAIAGEKRVGRSGQWHMRPLARSGWLRLLRTTKTGMEVYAVTPDARTALLSVPDDYRQDFFPLPRDIAEMKTRLRQAAP